MKDPPLETEELDHHEKVREERRQRRERRNLDPSNKRIVQASLPLGPDVFRELHQSRTVIIAGDMRNYFALRRWISSQYLVAYDLYCELTAFEGEQALSELASSDVLMDPQKVPRRDWPVWHKAVQHSCGPTTFYFVPDE